MKTKLLGLIACMALLSISQARATTYTYTGESFIVFPNGNPEGWTSLSGSVFVASPLPPSSLIVTGMTYSFTDGFESFVCTSNCNGAIFLGTNAAGAIDGWTMYLGGATNYIFSSGELGPPLTSGNDSVQTTNKPIDVPGEGYTNIVAYSDSAGAWSGPTVTTGVTPLPAALPLFVTGLGALGLFGWRRKRKASAAIAA